MRTCSKCGRVYPLVSGTTPSDVCWWCLHGFRLEDEKAKAKEYLQSAASSDTHSSDVSPDKTDPWEER